MIWNDRRWLVMLDCASLEFVAIISKIIRSILSGQTLRPPENSCRSVVTSVTSFKMFLYPISVKHLSEFAGPRREWISPFEGYRTHVCNMSNGWSATLWPKSIPLHWHKHVARQSADPPIPPVHQVEFYLCMRTICYFPVMPWIRFVSKLLMRCKEHTVHISCARITNI